MTALEGERLEFKEARKHYPFEKLLRDCAAIANEGGGRIILGVSDHRPRQIVGILAFEQPERTYSTGRYRESSQVALRRRGSMRGNMRVFCPFFCLRAKQRAKERKWRC